MGRNSRVLSSISFLLSGFPSSSPFCYSRIPRGEVDPLVTEPADRLNLSFADLSVVGERSPKNEGIYSKKESGPLFVLVRMPLYRCVVSPPFHPCHYFKMEIRNFIATPSALNSVSLPSLLFRVS